MAMKAQCRDATAAKDVTRNDIGTVVAGPGNKLAAKDEYKHFFPNNLHFFETSKSVLSVTVDAVHYTVDDYIRCYGDGDGYDRADACQIVCILVQKGKDLPPKSPVVFICNHFSLRPNSIPHRDPVLDTFVAQHVVVAMWPDMHRNDRRYDPYPMAGYRCGFNSWNKVVVQPYRLLNDY